MNEQCFLLFVPSHVELCVCVCVFACVCVYLIISYLIILSYLLLHYFIVSYLILCLFQYICLTLFRMYMRTCLGTSFNFNFNFNTWCPIVSREWNYSLQVSNDARTHTLILFNFNLKFKYKRLSHIM